MTKLVEVHIELGAFATSDYEKMMYWEGGKQLVTDRWNGRRAVKMEKALRNVWMRTGGERKSNRAGAIECIRTATMETGVSAKQTVDQASELLSCPNLLEESCRPQENRRSTRLTNMMISNSKTSTYSNQLTTNVVMGSSGRLDNLCFAKIKFVHKNSFYSGYSYIEGFDILVRSSFFTEEGLMEHKEAL
ncbi:hypothetical protein PoB_007174700 [Plakobranchus ocellatus]|uniref:Uncharacterized protein n=1 Tax=Plakobranchus ocellatus TaxID=259542 RepID=A0AAV4DLR3_9GAST|nr:hypothetical protein PoB_007174700 [Plakobranchus ocellatus]